MDSLIWLMVICVALIVLFDYSNGFHDTANMIATVIATHAMTPTQAILLVACFTFLGPLIAGTAVADTVGQFVLLDDLPAQSGIHIVLSGVIGAVGWNLLTWWRGLPSSSSHALVGGLIGAVLISAGADHVVWGWQALAQEGHWSGLTKIIAALLISPVAGLLIGYLLQKLAGLLLRWARPGINRTLRKLQWLTAAWLAFSHGANDAQKSMGIITLILLLGGSLEEFVVPDWVIFLCASAITLGTALGGWRIVRTVGFGIYKLHPLHALDAQLASALVISAAATVGGPVSTTHVVSSSIMGVGSADRPKSVRWGKAAEIIFTWFVTLPVSGSLAALFYLLTG